MTPFGPREPIVFLFWCSLQPRTILYKSVVNHVAMRSVVTHLVTGVCEKRYHPIKDKFVSATPLPVLVNVETKEAGTSKPSEKRYHFRHWFSISDQPQL